MKGVLFIILNPGIAWGLLVFLCILLFATHYEMKRYEEKLYEAQERRWDIGYENKRLAFENNLYSIFVLDIMTSDTTIDFIHPGNMNCVLIKGKIYPFHVTSEFTYEPAFENTYCFIGKSKIAWVEGERATFPDGTCFFKMISKQLNKNGK